MCVCLVKCWCCIFCVQQIITTFKVCIFSVKQMILFVHSTDASKPIRVCTVCKITIGSTKTVHWVWLYSWWGTSLLHGKWQGRRRYVYEHGASTLLTGKTELLLILIVEIKCLYVSVILNDKIFSPSDLNCFNTTQILVFFFFLTCLCFLTVLARLNPQIFCFNQKCLFCCRKIKSM